MAEQLLQLQNLLESAYKMAKKKVDVLTEFRTLPHFTRAIQVNPHALSHWDDTLRVNYCHNCRERQEDAVRSFSWLVQIGGDQFDVAKDHAISGFVQGWDSATEEPLFFVALPYGNQYTEFMFFLADPTKKAEEIYKDALVKSVLVA